MVSWYTPFDCKCSGLDTDWSYTLFFAFSAALAASFNNQLHLNPANGLGPVSSTFSEDRIWDKYFDKKMFHFGWS
jgi:hypothetical protein